MNVVHMGGSHVQGGTLSHAMRMNLAQLAPELNVERGFFFPHRLANTNMPGNIYVKKMGTWEGCRNSIPRNNCPWGFSGIDAITRDRDAGFALQSFFWLGKPMHLKNFECLSITGVTRWYPFAHQYRIVPTWTRRQVYAVGFLMH